MYTKTSQINNAGKGLFTVIDIFKHEVIAIFKGEKLSDAEAKHRAANKQDHYFISMIDGSVLDSMHVECFAKYANDAAYADSNNNNNSEITLDENNSVCIIATKNIKSGNEIFCSYGRKYWKKHG